MTESLIAAIDAAISRPSPWPFVPSLEATYRRSRGANRRARLARASRFLGMMILACGLLDLDNGFSAFGPAPLVRLACAAICFVPTFAVNRVRRDRAISWMFGLSVTMCVVASVAIGEFAGPRLADRYVFAAIMSVFAMLTLAPVEIADAYVIAALNAVALPLTLHFVPGALPLAGNWDIAAFAAGVFFTATVVSRRAETDRRREFLFTLRYSQTEVTMRELNRELQRLADTDQLTGLRNRRSFDRELLRHWDERRKRAANSSLGTGLVMIDVDHFKLFNDSAGHPAGDVCLRAVAGAIENTIRGALDVVARYGGEEFVVLVDGIAEGEIASVGERLRRSIHDLEIPHPGRNNAFVTASLGLAWCPYAAVEVGSDAALRSADEALYAAKRAGRDTAVLTRVVA